MNVFLAKITGLFIVMIVMGVFPYGGLGWQ